MLRKRLEHIFSTDLQDQKCFHLYQESSISGPSATVRLTLRALGWTWEDKTNRSHLPTGYVMQEVQVELPDKGLTNYDGVSVRLGSTRGGGWSHPTSYFGQELVRSSSL